MKQWRVILAVTIAALGTGAFWVWHEGPQTVDTMPASAASSAPIQQAPVAAPAPLVASDAAPDPAPPTAPPAEPAASVLPDNTQVTTNVAVEPPNVDTPEPAERKFAGGGRAESDRN